METLPVEMLEKIVQQLRPADLARCSAVSRGWREVFNQDWIWKPHCDPELEEPLRTIPSVATPKFVTPEVENSTLSPICHWRLAYMRQTHLWNNWRREDMSEDNKRMIGKKIDQVDFLTDTLIVLWYRDCIKIMDVSKRTDEIAAKTDSSVAMEDQIRRSVVGTTMLLVEKLQSVDVYSVDLAKKLITLKHCITLTVNAVTDCIIPGYHTSIANENLYIFIDVKRLNEYQMNVCDLNTSKIVKEEPLVQLNIKNPNINLLRVGSSSTSNYVVVAFRQLGEILLYLYSIEQLTFLPDVVKSRPGQMSNFHFALHRHWLAYNGYASFTVYNIQTRQVILDRYVDHHIDSPNIWESGDTFICLESDRKSLERLYKISPEQNTVKIIFESQSDLVLRSVVRTPKLLMVNYFVPNTSYLLTLSGKTVLKFEVPPDVLLVNQSFTCRILSINNNKYVNFLW